MDTLTMCRICLIQNMPMRIIRNTTLQDMYERLTGIPFEGKDCRPSLICYICCAKLLNCLRLQLKCLQSEEVFTQILQNNVLKTPLQSRNRFKIVHPFINISFVPLETSNQVNNITYDDIKDESLRDVQVKQEYIEDTEDNINEQSCVPYESVSNCFKNDDTSTDNDNSSDSHIQAIKSTDMSTSSTHLFYTGERKELEYSTQGPEQNNQYHRILEKILHSKAGHSTSYYTTELRDDLSPDDFKVFPRLELDNIKKNPQVASKQLLAAQKDNLQTSSSNKSKKKYRIKQENNKEKRRNKKIKKCKVDAAENEFKCDICDKVFTFKSNLHRHVELHTGERPYKCEICQKSYIRKSHLKLHNLVHTGEKQFKCDICDKYFTRKCYLNQHNLLHTTNKHFECDVCHKHFTRKGNLLEHIRVHTGVKPYKCNVCKQYFSHKSNLITHGRKIHKSSGFINIE